MNMSNINFILVVKFLLFFSQYKSLLGCPTNAMDTSLAFAFDTTGSMRTEKDKMVEGIFGIIDLINKDKRSSIKNYVLAPFLDKSKKYTIVVTLKRPSNV